MSGAQAPIARHSLHAAVTNRIRGMILDGALMPGSRLPERVLCGTACGVPHAAARGAQGAGVGGFA